MAFAPIVLFVYNRPSHTKLVLDNLSKNSESKESRLFIYCDGPKYNVKEQLLERINETRAIARTESRFKEVTIIEQPSNKGLANSVIEGVTNLCNEYGSVIVLEDDILPSPYFLKYMNTALELYKDVDKVGSINGYWYPVFGNIPKTFFLKNQSCWGWATWKRAWDLFERDGSILYEKIVSRKLSRDFDLSGSIRYTKMLKDQVEEKNDSWAIRWDASMYLAEKLSLYPCKSLVKNIGFDGSGIHSGNANYYEVSLSENPILVTEIPLEESLIARSLLIKFYRRLKRHYLLNQFKRLAYKFIPHKFLSVIV